MIPSAAMLKDRIDLIARHLSALIGGLSAVALGAVDLYARQRLTASVDVGLIAGGLSALGVKAGISDALASVVRKS